MNDIDLARLRNDLNLKDKALAGRLSLDASAKGKDILKPEGFDGAGRMVIEQGRIWKIDLLQGLGQFLFIPDFTNIVFKEGYTDFTMAAGDVIFENIDLRSSKMNLTGAGKISLKGNVHFILFPEFNPQFVASSDSLRRITTQFLGERGLVIEVAGPIKKPSYSMKPVFLSPIKTIEDFFKALRN